MDDLSQSFLPINNAREFTKNTHTLLKLNHIFSRYRTNNTKTIMEFTNKAFKPAGSSIATKASTPGAVSIDPSSMKGQQAFHKTKGVTDGPSYYPEDQDPKPAGTSIASTKAITPGAVSIDPSSMKGQQAFHKTKGVTDGPSFYPEDCKLQQLPSDLEEESASSKRAARMSQDEKSNEKLKQSGQAEKKTTQSHSTRAVAIADEKSKRRAARTERIVSKNTSSRSMDAVPMTDEKLKRSAARTERIASKNTLRRSMDPVPMTDEKLKRSAARKDRIASRSSSSEDTKQEVEQDQDVENMTPGAVQVSGMDSMDSTGDDQNDGLTRADNGVHSAGRGDEEDGLTITLEQNSTFGGATDLQHETSAVTLSTTTIVEAQLVEENEREQLEEELRQKLLDEQMGQVAQAEVVQDDAYKTRRRPLRWACSIVILLAIILGSVLGTRGTSSNAVSVLATTAPSVAPLNNSLCEEALPLTLGGGAIEDSLENAMEQVVVFCEFPDQPSDSQPGLWYKVRK